MAWAPQAINNLLRRGALSNGTLRSAVWRRIFSTSSAFTGLGTSEWSVDNSLRALNSIANPERGCEIRAVHHHGFEKNRQARSEHAAQPHGSTRHMFKNILDLLPPHLRKEGMRALKTKVIKPDLKQRILGRTMVLMLECEACGKKYRVLPTDWHTAGTPCTDHSNMNTFRPRNKGVQRILYLVWLKYVLTVQPVALGHENVLSFGSQVVEDLSNVYLCERSVFKSRHFGFATFRVRQCTVGLHRVNFTPGVPQPLRSVLTLVHETVVIGFHRAVAYSVPTFATPEEVQEELDWAASRKSVKIRRAQIASGEDPYSDGLEDWKSYLTPNERRRLAEYHAKYPDLSID